MAMKAPEGSSRFDAWNVPPEALIIKGYDDKDTNHPLCDAHSNRMEVDENFIKNISTYGVLEPIIVRKEDGGFVIVAGRHRDRGAREVNKQHRKAGEAEILVPVIVERSNDEDRLIGIRVSENGPRRQEVFRDNAEIARTLSEVNKWPLDRIAIAMGKTEQTVRSYLAFGELAPQVKKAVEAGDIKPSAAVGLAKLEKKDQVEKLEKLTDEAKKSGKKGPSLRQVRKATSSGPVTPTKAELRERMDALQRDADDTQAWTYARGVVAGLRWALDGGHAPTGIEVRP